MLRTFRIRQHQHGPRIDPFGASGNTFTAIIALLRPFGGRSFERRPAFQRREKALENLRCIGNGKTCMRNHQADFHAGTTGRKRFRNRRRFPLGEIVQRVVEGQWSILSCKAKE